MVSSAHFLFYSFHILALIISEYRNYKFYDIGNSDTLLEVRVTNIIFALLRNVSIGMLIIILTGFKVPFYASSYL